mmetsp:Transcript_13019/g.14954  ORF Transcript_13019/g.14954 Transcript_13019/m.14954 type:complete len:120 (-) Transcript_13019:137-496(-)
MAKGTPSKKGNTPDKTAKTKTTGNSIVRDHPLDAVIHTKRKRVPTARLLATQKAAKPKAAAARKGGAKKVLNRTKTMADTLAASKAVLKGSKIKGKTRGESKANKGGKKAAKKATKKAK